MKTRLPAFDVLIDLARTDPQGLESLRRSLTRAVIQSAGSANHRRRLEGLQFQIDMERRRAATPLAATIRISEMMCHSLANLHRSLVAPEEISDLDADPGIPSEETATILEFPHKDS